MIYLDYQATTPLAPEAREAMLPWLGGPDSQGFANPHSPHRGGRAAAAAIEVAREQVAALLPPGGRVVFTSGATEALNMALRGTQVSESTFLLGSLLNPASVAAARPGDLIFFGVGPSLLAHVAMYMGSNKVLTFGEFNFPGPAAVKIVDLKDFRKDIVQVRSYPLFLI